MSMNHNCIKCSEVYTSDDVDPYYCDKCNTERLRIAHEVDKKMAMTPPKRPRQSDLQRFDEVSKQRGSGNHVNIADLGISL